MDGSLKSQATPRKERGGDGSFLHVANRPAAAVIAISLRNLRACVTRHSSCSFTSRSLAYQSSIHRLIASRKTSPKCAQIAAHAVRRPF